MQDISKIEFKVEATSETIQDCYKKVKDFTKLCIET
jgi:hypothetical protein